MYIHVFLATGGSGNGGHRGPLVGTTGVLLTALCSAQRDDLCGHLFAFGRRRKSTTTRDGGGDRHCEYVQWGGFVKPTLPSHR